MLVAYVYLCRNKNGIALDYWAPNDYSEFFGLTVSSLKGSPEVALPRELSNFEINLLNLVRNSSGPINHDFLKQHLMMSEVILSWI